ncbi:chorismate synthase [bacterium BMS3Abin05]|nr:chorismate synthase [bacterium BMS3Abin05]GBE26581.1 chorismate synthase [bacterium BMS3Bbin03]HDZ11937.1 chorismate synthase [Bacteroidota bacterium]
MLRFLTAGDSHGPALVGILEGLPAHLPLDWDKINTVLKRRQGGYGRGKRMQMETDQLEILSGLWKGETTGMPLALKIVNRGEKKQETVRPRTVPRPGHADLSGAWKYDWAHDLNPIIERSSARETAMRVAIGAICKQFLAAFGIQVVGFLRALGGVEIPPKTTDLSKLEALIQKSDFYSTNPDFEGQLRELVDQTRKKGDSLGGIVEVITSPLPPGLGSAAHFDRKLDARLALHLMSIPSAKAVAVGDGIEGAGWSGSQFHDPIRIENGKIVRNANHAGGVEGGMTNGQPLRVQVFLKPIPTLLKPMATIDLTDGSSLKAPYIRSDIVIVPAGSVVAEALAAYVLAEAFLEKFGGDTMEDVRFAFKSYKKRLKFI